MRLTIVDAWTVVTATAAALIRRATGRRIPLVTYNEPRENTHQPPTVITVCPPGPQSPETQAAMIELATAVRAAVHGARCKVCKRLLTHHTSVERGAGAVCARKLKTAAEDTQ